MELWETNNEQELLGAIGSCLADRDVGFVGVGGCNPDPGFRHHPDRRCLTFTTVLGRDAVGGIVV